MVKVLDYECGSTGYGLMGFHFPPVKTPEAAIPVMKKAVELGNTFWSAADFYGTPENNSLHLLHAYFTAHPEDVDRVCISVKIGWDAKNMKTKTDAASLEAGLKECEKVLAGVKKIDIISFARVDPDTPVEDCVGTLYEFVKQGRVGAVGMSECSGATLRKAANVCPIIAVEVEFSLFTTDILTNDVAKVAGEIGAVVAAYSPLGRGVLTGAISTETIGENDIRRNWPRFQKEALENNLKLVKEIDTIAERRNATKGQIALAWVRSFSGRQGFPTILPIPGTTNAKRLDENATEIKLEGTDIQELNEIVEKIPVMGDRYPPAIGKLNWG